MASVVRRSSRLHFVVSIKSLAPVAIPIIGIGGISSIDDVMEFLVAGATAVQIGTANYYNPTVSMTILDQLPAALNQLGATSIQDVVRSLQLPQPVAPKPVAPTA